MGRRGPRPKPVTQLKLSGSARQDRHQEHTDIALEVPEPPDVLDDDARAVWAYYVPRLAEAQLLTGLDLGVLARYCLLTARWRRAEKFIQDNGDVYTVKDDKGKIRHIQQWPQVGIANKLAMQLTRLDGELGLTPSARSRVAKTGGKPGDGKRGTLRTG